VTLVYVLKRFPKFSETFVLQELRELQRQGEDVHVFALLPPHAHEPRHEGVAEVLARTRYLPVGRARWPLLAAAALAALVRAPRRAWPALWWCVGWSVRERRISHLRRFAEAAWISSRFPAGAGHIHAHFAHGPATVALLLARLTGRSFSFTGHARDIFTLVGPMLLRAKAREARFVVAVSEYTRAHVAAQLDPADRGKVVVVRNGVDRDRLAAGGREPDGVPLLLAVSRLVEKKGIDTLVDACGLLAARGVDFRCEVIGEGALRRALEDRQRGVGVDGRVALVGSRDSAAVREAYRRATLFVLPCRRDRTGDQDGLPVSIVEALAAGVPVVTTPVSGIPEAVRDGVSGVLVAPDDAAALADAVAALLADPARCAALADGGRAAAVAYDLEDCVARLRRLFGGGPRAA
jgi:glycosyltransferase involved in cell wall biosynthesis